MAATKNHLECQEKTGRIQDRINVFFERYHLGTLLNYSEIRKVCGTSPLYPPYQDFDILLCHDKQKRFYFRNNPRLIPHLYYYKMH